MSDWYKSRFALETPYKGHRFRSRIEARWAVFMDALGVQWEYEPQGFRLSGGGFYLPDFWLPYQECWIEIKGAPATMEEIDRADQLALDTGHPVVMLVGPVDPMEQAARCGAWVALPEPNERGYRETNGAMWAECLECGVVSITNGLPDAPPWCGHNAPGTTVDLANAWDAARGHRFGRA